VASVANRESVIAETHNMAIFFIIVTSQKIT
jgi:hypothetical protein